MTVVYEIVDETEWRKTNPLKYAHNGLSAVTVSAYDAIELLDEAEAEVERLQTLPESRHKAFLDLLERAEKAEAEVKEIRSALGDDGRRTHKEILEMAFKASGWREWKQKYTDLRNAHIAEGQDPAGTIWEHADKLQRELKASKAEVERLRKEIAFREDLDAVAQEVWDELKVHPLMNCQACGEFRGHGHQCTPADFYSDENEALPLIYPSASSPSSL